MITPADIHNKVFKKGFRGYNEEEVDDFLDQIINDYEALYRENNHLKEELKMSGKKLEQFHEMEKNLQDTLLVAQKTADDVMQNARDHSEELRRSVEKECAALKKQAEFEVRQKLESIEEQVRHKEDQYDTMLHRQRQFLIKIKALLRTELELLEEEGVRQTVGSLDSDEDDPEEVAAAEAEARKVLTDDIKAQNGKVKSQKGSGEARPPSASTPDKNISTSETAPVVLPWQKKYANDMRGKNGIIERDARVLAEKRRDAASENQGDKK